MERAGDSGKTLATGLILAEGRFRIDGKLGQGGMGAVYRATQLDLNRQVALKFVHPDGGDDPALVQRLRDEARAASRLGHPALVQVYDADVDPRFGLWVAFEFVDGCSLRDRLRDEGAMGWPRAWHDMGNDLFAALAACHDAGILHRDVKPENVFLRTEGGAKLGDLGLALFEGRGARTATGLFMGSPGYFPPERASGRSEDSRSDLYSAAVVLAEAITGRLPFRGKHLAEILRTQVDSPPTPTQLADDGMPANLARLLASALSPRPEERQGSVQDLARSLEACLLRKARGKTRVLAHRPSPAASAPTLSPVLLREPSDKPVSRPILPLLFLMLLLGVGLGFYLARGNAPAKPAGIEGRDLAESAPWMRLESWLLEGDPLEAPPGPEDWDALLGDIERPPGRKRLESLTHRAFPRSGPVQKELRRQLFRALKARSSGEEREAGRGWEALLSLSGRGSTTACLAWDSWLLCRYGETVAKVHPPFPPESPKREMLLPSPLDSVILPRLQRLAALSREGRHAPLPSLQLAVLEHLQSYEERRIHLPAPSKEERGYLFELRSRRELGAWKSRLKGLPAAMGLPTPPLPPVEEQACRVRAERALEALERIQARYGEHRRQSLTGALGLDSPLLGEMIPMIHELRNAAFASMGCCRRGPRDVRSLAAMSELIWELFIFDTRELSQSFDVRLLTEGRFGRRRLLPQIFFLAGEFLPLVNRDGEVPLHPFARFVSRWLTDHPERKYLVPRRALESFRSDLRARPSGRNRRYIEGHMALAAGQLALAYELLKGPVLACFDTLRRSPRPGLNALTDMRYAFAHHRMLLGSPELRMELQGLSEEASKLQNELQSYVKRQIATSDTEEERQLLVELLDQSWNLGIDLLRPLNGPSLDDDGRKHPELRRRISLYCQEGKTCWHALHPDVAVRWEAFCQDFARRGWIEEP